MSRWSVEGHRTARKGHMRAARRAAALARDPECSRETQRVWRDHARQHIKAARREHWLLVAQARAISAGMFLRKTIGAHSRAPSARLRLH